MAITVTVNSVEVTPAGGPISVRYTGSISGSGNGISWPSLAAFDLENLLGPTDVNSELGLLKFLMQMWKARSADLSNTGYITNAGMEYDPSSNNPIRKF